MGTEDARRYNRDQAKSMVDGIQRILDRVNRKYTPIWMLVELDHLNYISQCILQEFERVIECKKKL